MSLLSFFGFDNFGGALGGLTGQFVDFPASKAGIVGTPYETALPILYGGTGQYNSMGVPNDDRFRIGTGAERRNMLIAAVGGASSTYYAMARVGSGVPYTIGGSSAFSLTIGFNICDFSAAMPTGGYYAGRFCRAAGSLANFIEHVSGTNQYRLANTSALYTFTPGQPTYLEFIVDMPTPANNTFRCRAYVNGELWSTNNAFTSLTAQTTELFFEIGIDRVFSANRFIGFSDIYLLDATGEAPFNDRLGPQVVMPYKATAVSAPEWTLTGGTDPLTMLTDNNDATFVTSPVGKATINVDADLKLAPGSQVNGVAFFTKVGRDSGAPRSIVGSATRIADGVPIGTAISGPTAATPAYVTSARFFPKTPAERELLNFPDTGKLRVILTSEQPG